MYQHKERRDLMRIVSIFNKKIELGASGLFVGLILGAFGMMVLVASEAYEFMTMPQYLILSLDLYKWLLMVFIFIIIFKKMKIRIRIFWLIGILTLMIIINDNLIWPLWLSSINIKEAPAAIGIFLVPYYLTMLVLITAILGGVFQSIGKSLKWLLTNR